MYFVTRLLVSGSPDLRESKRLFVNDIVGHFEVGTASSLQKWLDLDYLTLLSVVNKTSFFPPNTFY